MNRQLAIQNEWHHEIPIEEVELERCFHKAMDELAISSGEVTLRFTDDKEIRALNATYRDIDKPTNVLSFTLDPIEALQLDLWGDIVMSMDTVLLEAKRDNKAVASHIAHLFIHGCLHLAGFDHGYDEQAEEMESLETNLLLALGYDDPYHD